jgi:hypothetical protein
MRRSTPKRSIALVSRSRLRQCVAVISLVAAIFLLCQCKPQSQAPAPTSGSTVTPSPSAHLALPSAETPTPTTVPEATPAATPVASLSPFPMPSVSATPDPFEEGVKKLLEASQKGFLEFRGKFKRTENGSGPLPLFRVRKFYEGSFLFGGAASAELEEVYFNAGRQPVYNYHLYYQASSRQDAVEKYDELRQNLGRLLKDFEHTIGGRYDSWARDDPLKTAILLSSRDVAGSLEIQFHTTFQAPQW